MGGMYVIKVLLVDDEQYIREGLRQLVDWEEYGYEIKQPKGGSSHYSFVKSGCNRIVIPRHKPIKKVYVKMIKKVIEEEMKEYESRTQILHESVVSYGNC